MNKVTDTSDPKFWGKPSWIFLYSVVLKYPANPTEIEKKNMSTFLLSIQHILPCESCRMNMAKHMTKYKLDDVALSSNDNLFNWLLNIHNSVNQSQNRGTYTREQIINNYLTSTNGNISGIKQYITQYEKYVVIAIILMIILFLIYFMKVKK